MNKSLKIFFLFYFLFTVNNTNPKLKLSHPSGNILISGSLEVTGTTNVLGTILCLSNVNAKNLVTSNVNCNFNTTPLSTETSPSINFGSPNTTNTIVLKGLLERNDFSNFLVTDESGKLFQKNIQFEENFQNKTLPKIIDNIDKLYLQSIINYTAPAVTIVPQNTNLTINTINTSSIELVGQNIFLNFKYISTSHDSIYFITPLINTNNTITANTAYFEKNLTLANFQTSQNTSSMTFFGDLNLNSGIHILGPINIDGNQITLSSSEPIAMPSSNIQLYGISETTENLDGFLGLNQNNELLQITNTPSFLSVNFNSPDGQTMTIKPDTNQQTETLVFTNTDETGITLMSNTLYINGTITTKDQSPIIFNSEVFFFTPQ
jgi:hypothetical protein